MSLTEQVRKALPEAESSLRQRPGFVELSEFYHEMVRRGIIQKKRYEFPLLDTIGRSLYRKMKRVRPL